MRHFLKVFGAGTILCPSASCAHLVRQGYPQLAEGQKERRAVEALASRVLELEPVPGRRGRRCPGPPVSGRLALHRSCKARQLGGSPRARGLFSRVAGLELLEVSPYYSCCGFGGAFTVQHPELSREMGEAYLEAVMATGAGGWCPWITPASCT